MTNSKKLTDAIEELVQTVHRLRAPGGCPWDREQTHLSLRPYLIEEAYEVLDIIDQIKTTENLKDAKIKANFREELGDLLMQVLLHSEMASEVEAFDFKEVAENLNSKLIRRHPHVFGDSSVDSSDAALKKWEQQKAKEKGAFQSSSVLDGLPRNLPALQKTARMIEKVSKVGFQWTDLQGPFQKVEEEWQELKTAVEDLNQAPNQTDLKHKVESELGDLLFSLCNVGFLMKLNPEDCLRNTLQKFESRFRYVEKKLQEKGKTPDQSDLNEMDEFWNEAKEIEKK